MYLDFNNWPFNGILPTYTCVLRLVSREFEQRSALARQYSIASDNIL